MYATALLGLLALAPAALSAEFSLRNRWAWTPLGYAFGERGLSAVDVDADGRAELFAVPWEENYWYELRREGQFRQTWSSLLDEEELVSLESFGAPTGASIAVLYAHSLRLFDGSTKAERLRFATPSFYNTAVALGDLDLDGVLDAVVCDEQTLFRFELANGGLTATRHGFGCTDVAIGQLDVDLQLEVVIAGNPAGGYVLDGLSLAVQWGDLEGFGRQISLGDLDGDGRDEILASTDSQNLARAIDPETDSELWRSPAGGFERLFLVADLHPAPGAEAIVHERQTGFGIRAGATGQLLQSPSSPTSHVSGLAAADTDGDGDVELLWSGGPCCANPSGLWALEVESTVVEKVVEDVHSLEMAGAFGRLGDSAEGEAALAVRSGEPYEAHVQLLVLEMSRGRQVRRSSFDEAIALENVSAMVDSQVDSDAASEICMGSVDVPGSIRCVDGQTFSEEWTGGALGYIDALAEAELDGDSTPELLAGTSGTAIEAREGESGWLKWRTPNIDPNYDSIDRLLTLDVDGDGIEEILGRMQNYPNDVGPLALFASDKGELLSGPWSHAVWAMAKPELVEAPPNRVYVALVDSTIRGLDPENGAVTAPVVTLPGISRALAVVDLDRDGTLDFIVVDQYMYLHVVDGSTASVTWDGPYLGPNLHGRAELWLEAGDLDGNGVPDFAVASEYGLFYFEGPLFGLFVDGFETGDTSAWSGAAP